MIDALVYIISSGRGLECRLIHRYDFHKSLISWADIVLFFTYLFIDLLVCISSHRGLECRLIHRYDFHKSLINWADIVFTAGGDGTFLMVASNIHDSSKPVVGINTDPLR